MHHIIFLGAVKHSDMRNYYALTDLIVCPSRFEGGILAVIVEQMAVRKSVIISSACDAGNLPWDVVRKFEVGDVISLSNEIIIINLSINSGTAEGIGKKSKKLILKGTSKGRHIVNLCSGNEFRKSYLKIRPAINI